MKKYEIAIVIGQTVYVKVDADSFDDAVKKARDEFSENPSDYVDEDDMHMLEYELSNVED